MTNANSPVTAAATPRTRSSHQIVEGLGGVWGQDDIGDWTHRVGDVIAALRELGATYRQREQIQHRLADGRRSVLAAHTSLGRALAEMERASDARGDDR